MVSEEGVAGSGVVFQGLRPDFSTRCQALLADLASKGCVMRALTGLRTPAQQAASWRQSRAKQRCEAQVETLKAQGALFLAATLAAAAQPAKLAPWATNAIPGLSWHQWGEALDCCWVWQGQICWDTKLDGADNGYAVYMKAAEAAGLWALGLHMAGDQGHIQLRPLASPSVGMSIKSIDQEMKRRFGNGPA